MSRPVKMDGVYQIGDLVYAMCDRLGINPQNVSCLTIEPRLLTLEAEVLLRKVPLAKNGRGGNFYVDPATGDAAVQVFEFHVETAP